MRARRAVYAATVGLILGGIAFTTPADAAKCGARPDGIVDPNGPESGTWDSPGEVISFFNKQGFHSNQFDAPPGQTVKALCAGPNP